MSTISNLIFKDKYNYVTSPYGKRRSFGTSAGVTSTFHYGTDYGTNGKKLPQYAIEDGFILRHRKRRREIYLGLIPSHGQKAFALSFERNMR